MEKTKINFDILLPEVPSERDECVARIISRLHGKRGIDKVHVIPENGENKAQLCFHYNPDAISINDVEQLAKKAGAEITEHYGHLLIELSGVFQPRQARMIEANLRRHKGIQNVTVSGTGFIQLEFNNEGTSEEAIIQQIQKADLEVSKIENFHLHEYKE